MYFWLVEGASSRVSPLWETSVIDENEAGKLPLVCNRMKMKKFPPGVWRRGLEVKFKSDGVQVTGRVGSVSSQ